MFRFAKYPVFWMTCLLGLSLNAAAEIDLEQYESRFGKLQGQIDMGQRCLLVFPSAKVTVFHETGEVKIKHEESRPYNYTHSSTHSPSSLRTIKRNIGRLPVHEQVRYWKLHQIRYPDSDVTEELESALDRMEAIRKEAMVVKTDPVEPVREPTRRYNRSRTNFLPYFPSFGYSTNYRHRRSHRKDTQIELDRIQRQREPAESWTTPMSIADRARSDALAKVSGARSSLLGSR